MSMAVSREKVSSTSTQCVQNPLSLKGISQKILSIEALQIEQLGNKVLGSVGRGVGAVGKVGVAQWVAISAHQALEKGNGFSNLVFIMSQAQADIEGEKKQFFSTTHAAGFYAHALPQVKTDIAHSFSTHFLTNGFSIRVSNDDKPTGFINKVMEKIGIKLTEVARDYCVHLNLDVKLTCEKGELVFTITEESVGLEINNISFTMSDPDIHL